MDSRETFEKIVRQEGKRIYNLAYRLCGNAEDAKDIAQETFLRAFKSYHNFQGKAQIYTYLYRITFNIWKNKIRRRKRHPVFSFCSSNPEEKEIDPADPSPAPDKVMEKKEMSSLVQKCLQSLPPSERMIIILRDIEGRHYQEIARILKCRLGTVKSRLSRARESLRVKLLPYIE